jgi:hypothetical protein
MNITDHVVGGTILGLLTTWHDRQPTYAATTPKSIALTRFALEPQKVHDRTDRLGN